MGQSRSRNIDMTYALPNNVMVIIFSHLSLYDKLIAPRVCTRWYTLMKEKRPWQCIDFWDKGPSKNHQSEPWLFPAKEDAILNLLRTHAGSALLQIHLRFISAKILTFLNENCPYLRVFSFLPRNSNTLDDFYSYKSLLCDERVSKTFSDIFIIPPTVVECRLNFLANYNVKKLSGNNNCYESTIKSLLYVSEEQQAEETARSVSKCTQLKYLALHSYKLTLRGVQLLTDSIADLRELCLIDAKVIDDNEKEIFKTFVNNLKKLQIFKFSGYGNVDFILDEVVGWTSLRELWLGRLDFTDDAFLEMTSKMPQLEILGIDIIISDSILSAISGHLPKLKELSLLGGEYSDNGLNSLRGHQSLQSLYISDYEIEKGPEFSLQTVHRVIKSLPKIENVTISCQRLKRRYSGEILPAINKPNLKVEVDYF
ncbi:uncharacterized protein [Amphiura filiformis]|uniref:uncharacterized protein n=1 Tax=Amphiura filiformis TaxID=82378 RepID=UPI003B21E235